MLELCCLAQVCVTKLGLWDLAGKINRGEDLHVGVGAQLLGVTYQQGMQLKKEKDPKLLHYRNCGKVVNFGGPGGMAAKTLRLAAKRGYGLELSLEFCTELLRCWKLAQPDCSAFLEWIRRLPKEFVSGLGQRYSVQIPGTTLVRRGCTYCAAANTHFQGLGAVLEGSIGYEIAREQFTGIQRDTGERSPLSHSHTWCFVHDEFILETTEDTRTEVATRLNTIMVNVAKPYLPDVAIKSEVTVMRRWSKHAFSEIGTDGEYTIWDDSKT
jgi:hypothetical protein